MPNHFTKPTGNTDREPSKCPQCSYLKKGSGKCPVCGCTPQKTNTTEHAEGDLKKLERTKKMKTDEKRQLYSELLFIANERKWSDGRLSNVFRDLAGTWPNAYKNEAARVPSQETRALVQHLNIKFAKSKARHA